MAKIGPGHIEDMVHDLAARMLKAESRLAAVEVWQRKRTLTVGIDPRNPTGVSMSPPADKLPKRYPWDHHIGFETFINIQSMRLSWEEAWLYTTDRAAFDLYWQNKAKKESQNEPVG